MAPVPRHKVFISFHEQDIKYKQDFVRKMGKRIVDRSVDTGNIDTSLMTATVRQKIRDEYIRGRHGYDRANRPTHLAANARGLGDRFEHQEDHEEP